MRVFLETERLILRQFTEADVDNAVELDSDPDVMYYINGGRPTPRSEIEQDYLPGWMSYYPRYPGYGFWAAVEKATGDFLGWFLLRPLPNAAQDEPELGYRLRKSAWGKGYATEGSRALIDKAFTELGTQRIWAETMTVNTASRRVMEKAGLKFVRLFFQDWPDSGPIDGEQHGDVEYAITRAEWANPSPNTWLPADFTHPGRVDLDHDLHLRPIRATDVDLDHPAVMGSRDRLWAAYGDTWGWPPATLTLDADREDLARHEAEIRTHISFDYALFNVDETALLGCVYLDPPEKPGADVDISWWVIDDLAGTATETMLADRIPRWVAESWPFRQPRYRQPSV